MNAQTQRTWEQAVEWARGNPDMSHVVTFCYYDDPIELAAARFKASEEWPAITRLTPLRRGARVLEIGAGRGIVSWSYASEGCEVSALEPDPSEVVGAGAIRRLCRATGQQIDIVETASERLPFPDATFDYVVCRAVLHHVTSVDQVCREAYRVLKPGGRFLALKEHIAESPAELAAFLDIHPLHHLYGGENAFPLGFYLRCLREAGFSEVRNFGQFDDPVSSYPLISSPEIRANFASSLSRFMPSVMADWLAGLPFLISHYRRWMTLRCRTPGRVHSFLATK